MSDKGYAILLEKEEKKRKEKEEKEKRKQERENKKSRRLNCLRKQLRKRQRKLN